MDTVITGLTSTPITLTNSFAQSYGPGHHNFTEDFIFEPGLDPSVTPAQKAELNAKNIRLIHVFHNQMDFGVPGVSGDKLTILGLDGSFRVASQVTLQDVHLNVGKNKVLVATGIDANGKSYTFSNPVWQINGGGTLTNQGAKWTLTADQSGKWELTCTDPAKPGITGRATLLVAGVVLDWNGTLQIIGTGGNDNVSVSQSGQDSLRVQANFLAGKNRTVQFALDQVYQIEVYGGTGHDTLNASRLSTPVMIDGGEGNDLIRGGRGDDLLVGGAGHDLIWGGDGADILLGGDGNDLLWGDGGYNLLIGGDGRDLLFGGQLEDILLGGKTIFSDPPRAVAVNRQALRAILEEWKSPRTNPVRRANLSDGSGSTERLNDNYFLQLGSTLFDDGQRDTLLGTNKRHWHVSS